MQATWSQPVAEVVVFSNHLAQPGSSRDEPPAPINWNLLDAERAAAEWRDLDAFVHWLKTTFGLSPAIVSPYWHRHDELIWELSALHTHFLAYYDETSSPSTLIAWMRDFADARHRLHPCGSGRSRNGILARSEDAATSGDGPAATFATRQPPGTE